MGQWKGGVGWLEGDRSGVGMDGYGIECNRGYPSVEIIF
jgi:hypothetical protein